MILSDEHLRFLLLLSFSASTILSPFKVTPMLLLMLAPISLTEFTWCNQVIVES